MQYYIMVEEWRYPTESGSDLIADYSADELDEALEKAESMVDAELENFRLSCCGSEWPMRHNNMNGGNPMMCPNEMGCMLTTKDGLDPWYYAVRLIPIVSLDSQMARKEHD